MILYAMKAVIPHDITAELHFRVMKPLLGNVSEREKLDEVLFSDRFGKYSPFEGHVLDHRFHASADALCTYIKRYLLVNCTKNNTGKFRR